MRRSHLIIAISVFALWASAFILPMRAMAASAEELNRNVQTALQKLYAQSPAAKELSQKAKAILVFPDVVKGGFVWGGQYGEGAMVKGGKVVGYYNTVSASYGLQAGLQKYGYALFLMSESMVEYLDKSGGFELGLAPNIVVVDVGTARSLSTTTAKADAYAFFFDQKGLMGGLGVQGTKITKIEK